MNEKHEQEINQFKAKLYDKKESESTSPVKAQTSSNKDESSKNEAPEEDSTKTDDTNPQS